MTEKQKEILGCVLHSIWAEWATDLYANKLTSRRDGSMTLTYLDSLYMIGKASTHWHELTEAEREAYREQAARMFVVNPPKKVIDESSI